MAGSIVSSKSWNRSLSSRDTGFEAVLAAAETTVKVKIATSTQQKKMWYILDMVGRGRSSNSSFEVRSSEAGRDVVEAVESRQAKACFSGSSVLVALVEDIANQNGSLAAVK